MSTKCNLCHDTFTIPKVLSCLHTFCQPCLEKDCNDKVKCPQCGTETQLPPSGIMGLLSDYAISNMLENVALDSGTHSCTSCRSRESAAIARCFDCANFLCPNCVMAHQFMHCFEGHRVMTLCELQRSKDASAGGELKPEKPVSCLRHKNESLNFFCHTCNLPICNECTLLDHPKGLHDYDLLAEIAPKHVEGLTHLIEEGRLKTRELKGSLKTVEQTQNRLQMAYHKAQSEVGATFQFYRSLLDERRQETLKDLENIYNTNALNLNVLQKNVQDTIDKINRVSEFVGRLTKFSSNTEIMVFKQLLDSKFQNILSYQPDINSMDQTDLEFASNYQAIQAAVRVTFGYIKQGDAASQALPSSGNNAVSAANGVDMGTVIVSKPMPPIARPNGGVISGSNPMYSSNPNNITSLGSMCLSNSYSNTLSSSMAPSNPAALQTIFDSSTLTKRLSSASSLGPFSTSLDLNPYEKWSTGGCGDIFNSSLMPGTNSMPSSDFPMTADSVGVGATVGVSPVTVAPNVDLSSKFGQPSAYPLKSQLKRQKMIYHCKFGEFGVMEGQFTEPSGVAVNAQNDIIVADTNNHRIQIFDKEGRFKFQFGECGKRDGQLLYPNRVSVVKTSGDIIVTERSPTHQIQIYNQYGQFVRKFGANILQHPRGITVDNKGRIIVVECKVMRVLIFDQAGNVLQKFGCSKHLEFPNGVVVNDKQEIFISDNRAHCVKVFNYDGLFLRQIGGEGVTNYPIGVCINQQGEILVADNHNNFNITIFTQDGQLVNALESKVKHAQCFDVALMDDGSVVLASKDYRLYIYRYIQVPALSL
ncbi:B-box type zinc finger protein ncl-1-like [Galendromus occidentalis]|uniref:B-box type zinc finger protein ncl-1-like n=1 Tax=Galendromus occidentalis TaxID=34638 RepID=A0AAJ7L7K4_9ACAR|nr:B-box type zinc finger protein ncl-1-like [Galendromus occidentalis]